MSLSFLIKKKKVNVTSIRKTSVISSLKMEGIHLFEKV